MSILFWDKDAIVATLAGGCDGVAKKYCHRTEPG